LVQRSAATGVVSALLCELGELSQNFEQDDSTMKIIVVIIIIFGPPVIFGAVMLTQPV